ncbi:MAG: hypothetical protein NT018_01750 [Armatimonadetes bacterium]|nr:hypothetical protein [Armatimonadota bacterium]
MHRVSVSAIIFSVLLLMAVSPPVLSGRLNGEVTQVTDFGISATFPAAVKPGSAMMVMSGMGESVCAMAISDSCQGEGPYFVSGKLAWITDILNLRSGKVVYVNSLNASAIPSPPVSKPKYQDQDLRFYYYSAAQNLGYGAVGLGLERSLRISKGLALEIDGGITGMGNLAANGGNKINTDCVIKNFNGRLKMDLVPGFCIYTGYRWNEGRGNDQRWSKLIDNIPRTEFLKESEKASGTVLLQGLEYGLTIRPFRAISVSAGYVPQLRTDFGSIGISSEPAYTGELRFGYGSGAIRLRGMKTNSYWLADLSITIK